MSISSISGLNNPSGGVKTKNCYGSASELESLLAQILQLVQQSTLSEEGKRVVKESTQKIFELVAKEQMPERLKLIKEAVNGINNSTRNSPELYIRLVPLLVGLYAYFKLRYHA